LVLFTEQGWLLGPDAVASFYDPVAVAAAHKQSWGRFRTFTPTGLIRDISADHGAVRGAALFWSFVTWDVATVRD
jgi:hypothetical protein